MRGSGVLWREAYLSDPSDVLHAVLRREAQVFVQPESHIVAVQSVGLQAEVEKMLLECCCNGRFARGGQAGEPYGAASLLAEVAAFFTGKAWVPCNVPVSS